MTLILLILLGAVLWWMLKYVRIKIARNNTKERLFFGNDEFLPDVADINLAAGDYGLSGRARLLYYLNQSLSTPIGYASIFTVGALAALLIKFVTKVQSFGLLMMAVLGGALLLLTAIFYLRRQTKNRLRQIKFELPTALQTIVAIMESGMAFESALKHLVQESNKAHPLYFDLSVLLEAMQRGRRRNEALRLWAARAKEPSVTEVVGGIVQAEQTGASLGSVLKHHAHSLLKENEAELLRRAERIPIYMLAPMMLCIMPPIMIVAVGPSILRIVNMFTAIMSKA